MKFGDPVTNICAGDRNPSRHAYFVRKVTRTHRNKFGLSSKERLIQCTDKKGKFWETGREVIYPGHLDYEECNKLFAPIWEKKFGNQT